MTMTDFLTAFDLLVEYAKKAKASQEGLAMTMEQKLHMLESGTLEAKDLEIQDLKAKISALEAQNSGPPIILSIIGSWKLLSSLELDLQLKAFSKEQRHRFEMLLKAETFENKAKYTIKNGAFFNIPTLEDCSMMSTMTHKTITSKVVFADGEKGEIVRSMSGGMLKMVLKSNGEEMKIFWSRTEDSEDEWYPPAFQVFMVLAVIMILGLLAINFTLNYVNFKR